MPVVVPLSETISGRLDFSGNGTVRIGPLSSREVWRPVSVHVKVATAVKEPTCTIEVGDINSRTFRDATYSGSANSSNAVNADILKNGDYVWATWVGGDANAVVTLTVTGQKDV